jgi:hypothetical protein
MNPATANEGYGNTDIFYLSRSQSTPSNSNKLIIGYNGGTTGTDMSCLLPPYLPSPSYVASTSVSNGGGGGYKAIDREYCGTKKIRCCTISYIDGTIDPTHDYVINVADGDYEEWKLTSQSSVVRDIRGTSTTSTKITVVNKESNSNPMFYIPLTSTNSILIISTMTLIVNTSYSLLSVKGQAGVNVYLKNLIITSKNPGTSLPSNISIIEFTSGSSIQLTNVIFNNILSQASVLKIGSGDAFLSNCQFKNISLKRSGSGSNGEGGVLHITVDNTKTAELTDGCYFENITVDTGGVANGGALYVNLKQGYFYVHGSTSFKNCSAKSTNSVEGKGCVMLML